MPSCQFRTFPMSPIFGRNGAKFKKYIIQLLTSMDRREITGNRPWTSATCPRPISWDQLADQVRERARMEGRYYPGHCRIEKSSKHVRLGPENSDSRPLGSVLPPELILPARSQPFDRRHTVHSHSDAPLLISSIIILS